MLVLGLQGSPRKNGNTDILLSAFMAAAREHGATTETIFVTKRDIKPCMEYIVCEKKGFCPIDDDMASRNIRPAAAGRVWLWPHPGIFLQYDRPTQGPRRPVPDPLGQQGTS